MPQGNELIDGKILKYTQLFSLWGTHFGKRTLKTVKLLESIILNCCAKETMIDLHKIRLKMRE